MLASLTFGARSGPRLVFLSVSLRRGDETSRCQGCIYGENGKHGVVARVPCLQAAEALSREDLIAVLEETRLKVAQLEGALESRVAVEQAKGVLAERLGLSLDEAFLLLRYAARASRSTLRELARAVVQEPRTPTAVVIALSRQERWRAALMRERAEAQRERAARFFDTPG
jgi:hypothetical protein